MNNLETQALNHLNLVLGSQHEWAVLLGVRNGLSNQVLFFTDNTTAAEEAIRLSELGYNVYFSPNTMSIKPSSGRGVESDFTTQNAIVVDIDIEGCDKHKSDSKRKYADSVETAMSFLTLEPSLVVSTGYGIHAYYLLKDNKSISKDTSINFIKAIRSNARRAGFVGVDSTFALNHLFRLPGTRNFKKVEGKIPSNPPICSIIKSSNVRYDLNDLAAKTQITATTTFSNSKSAEADFAWVKYFFKRISADRLSYEQWRNAIWIGHALGMPIADLDAWSSLDSARYAGTGSIEKLISEYRDNGLGVGTLRKYLEELEPNDFFVLPNTSAGNDLRMQVAYGGIIKWFYDCWCVYKDGVWSVKPETYYDVYGLIQSLKQSYSVDAPPNKILDSFDDATNVYKTLEHMKGNPFWQINPRVFNTHRDLLNVSNGVVNLHTGELLPHDPKYFFTYKLDTPYIPLSNIGGSLSDPPTTARPADTSSSAPSISDAEGVLNGIPDLPQKTDIGVLSTESDLNTSLLTVQRFFKSILPDTDTRNALLRYLGYCLTGETGEQKALFIYGRGANGKSVLLSTIRKLLGDYTIKLPSSVFTENPSDPSKATPYISLLEYKRLGIVPEQKQFSRLQSEQFKSLVGEDSIFVRDLYKSPKEIELYCKLIMCGNYQMDLTDANDLGVQRRILQIDFLQDFSKTGDPRLLDKLTTPNALTVLLSLLVEQSKLYYKEGLLESKDMAETKKEYIYSNDFISEFIDEYCVREGRIKYKSFITKLIEVYPNEYNNYTYKELIKLILNVPGITKTNIEGFRYFKGVSLIQ